MEANREIKKETMLLPLSITIGVVVLAIIALGVVLVSIAKNKYV